MTGRRLDLRGISRIRELPILIYVVVMIAVFSIAIDDFFSLKSVENITRQITTVGIVSIGMTLVILTGGIDLSVGPSSPSPSTSGRKGSSPAGRCGLSTRSCWPWD